MKTARRGGWVSAAALMASALMHCSAADVVIVESRKADGTPNAPLWTAISGDWGTSKNKSRVNSSPSLVATNVSIARTNHPAPAFKVTPQLQAGTRYKVEATFSTTSTHVASPDLIVAVTAEGVSSSTMATNTAAFQGGGADTWNLLGTITPSTNRPSLTFTYVSGTLSPTSRWYADAIRFTPESQ